MPLQVIANQGLCKCLLGDFPTPITVTSNQTVFCHKQLAATIMDFAPIVNIKPFGTCKTLTAAALGVPTPCVPATVAPWITGSVLTSHQKMPALRDCDTLLCAVGGLISITFAGQPTTNVT